MKKQAITLSFGFLLLLSGALIAVILSSIVGFVIFAAGLVLLILGGLY